MNTAVLHLPPLSKVDLLAGLVRWRTRANARRRARAARQELSALGQRDFSDLGVGRSEMDYWLESDANGAQLPRR
jgi:uncharacterized protein YjiS (DUF1127 family)